ncbi:MAG TPA: DUF1641 domain-containing protein [Anaerolineae bacterium]|jgi:uncharacterized protein YjgD (DUF1641 family)|nr:DUF1641 domain-containing protein [Anaerolineae bacterium]
MAESIIDEEVMLSDEALTVLNRDLVSFVETLKDLVGQLEPQVKALAKELSPITNTIKSNLDRDETIVLIERLTANTSTILEVISMLEGLNDLRRELEPQLKALSKEASPVLNSIKANIDRDETLLLVDRLAANTGTLLELVGYLEMLNDLKREIEPQLKGIAHEFSPRLNTIRANIDKDETFLLLERLTANTGTFLELIDYFEALNDLRNQLEPQLKALSKEAAPVMNAIKSNLDRDETLLLVERLTANTGTLLEMISLLEGLNDLRNQLEPQLKAMIKEVSPALTALRSFAENEKTIELTKRAFNSVQALVEDEEVLGLIDRAGSLKQPLMNFMNCVCTNTGESGEGPPLVKTSLDSLLRLTEIAGSPVVQNLVDTTTHALEEASTKDIQPVSPLKLISTLRDKDVQRATGFLMFFLKKLGQGLNGSGKTE